MVPYNNRFEADAVTVSCQGWASVARAAQPERSADQGD